ncbi:DUF4097 family beta strand repeat-containing protein [Longimicrobium sp.]|uniref:DUF4097 family beta strand repeat-containing protein n=1 Tax=Longimicrobium sp. TaxID=2029185 RepID=UPI002CF4816C|nr:hypothetical protein [Longimicrobium sp.]HSU16673.1 hypothetical protein [Longimicrobium sp.]
MIRMLGTAATAAMMTVMAARPHTGPVDAHAAAARQQGDFRWSGRIANGERIQINNIVGNIRAEPTDGDQVTVTGVRAGRGAERVRIEVVHRGTGTVICAIYPSDDNGGWRRDDDDDDDDRDNGQPRDACNQRGGTIRDNGPRVDFTVRVPAGVRLSANTVSGDVEARALRGPVQARSVSGNVRVATSGPVEASTVSGSVVATLGRTGGEDLDFRSVSGDVTLQVPAGIDADFEARTLSGSIDSDFPLELGRGEERGRMRIAVGQHVHGTLGRGGPALRVHTVSGDVALRRIR